jgi:hypothetical protein
LFFLGLWLLFATVFFASGQSAKKAPEKPIISKQLKPLIRKDLLLKKENRRAEPKRDLFSRQMILGSEGTPQAVPQVKDAISSDEKPGIESGPPLLTMHYIGFSHNRTKQKYIALVLFEGQVRAVSEGEMLGPNWKVLKITAGEIEVQGDDGKSQKFGLEGERR